MKEVEKNNKCQESLLSHENEENRRKKEIELERKKISDWVIKYLMPHYRSKRILSKELFKKLARSLTHKISLNETYGKSFIPLIYVVIPPVGWGVKKNRFTV